MSKQFHFKQFSLAWEHSLVLFDPLIEPYQVLSLRSWVGLWSDGKEWLLRNPQIYSITRVDPSNCLVSYSGHSYAGVSHPIVEKLLMYSTALPTELDSLVSYPEHSFLRGRGLTPLHCPMGVLDMSLKNLIVSFLNAGALGNAEYPFIAISPRSTLAWSCST